MTIAKDNWSGLASLFPSGWQEMAWQSGALGEYLGCGFAQTPAQERGMVAFTVHRTISRKLYELARRSGLHAMRIVDGTIIKEPGRTGNQ